MKPRRNDFAHEVNRAGNFTALTYSDCAFGGCKGAPAEGLGFPLCPNHCRTVYLQVKDMLDNASLSLTIRSAYNYGKPKRTSKTLGKIYFARIENLIKIGYSTNVRQRMKALNGQVLATIPGTTSTEKAMHARFGSLWVRGEYFRPEQELMDYIDSIAV